MAKHIFGTKSLLRNYFSGYLKGFFWRGLRIPLLITILICTYLYWWTDYECYTGIEILSGLIISIIPALVGFILAGYALLIGFGHSQFVAFLAKNRRKKFTLYESINIVFAGSLVVHLISIFSGIIASILISLSNPIEVSYELARSLNCIYSSLLLLLLIWSLFSVKDMIINVFNFGQMYQFYTNANKAKHEPPKPPMKHEN